MEAISLLGNLVTPIINSTACKATKKIEAHLKQLGFVSVLKIRIYPFFIKKEIFKSAMPSCIVRLRQDDDFILIMLCLFHDNSSNNQTGGCGYNYQPTCNPLDKIIELSSKVEKLYKALLKSEQEKNALLEKLLKERK